MWATLLRLGTLRGGIPCPFFIGSWAGGVLQEVNLSPTQAASGNYICKDLWGDTDADAVNLDGGKVGILCFDSNLKVSLMKIQFWEPHF